MELKMTLALPRDEMTIPVVRRTLLRSMEVLGVEEGCRGDIEVALSEACTNVLDHAVDGEEYEVSCGIDEDVCVIEVVDTGAGFDSTSVGAAEAEAETGRGIQLMRALVDRVRFENRAERGTVVHLEKRLEWHEGAPIKRLMSDETRPRLWRRPVPGA